MLPSFEFDYINEVGYIKSNKLTSSHIEVGFKLHFMYYLGPITNMHIYYALRHQEKAPPPPVATNVNKKQGLNSAQTIYIAFLSALLNTPLSAFELFFFTF